MDCVILTRDDPYKIYFCNRLHKEVNVKGIIFIRKKQKIRFLLKNNIKTLFHSPYKFLSKIKIFYERIRSRKFDPTDNEKREIHNKIFGNEWQELHKGSAKIYYVENISSEHTEEILRKLNPDVISIFGTPLVKKNIFTIPNKACFNLHWGLSPYYRGGNCTFWCIFNEEPECIGVTIHEIDSDIDAGPIIHQGRPTIEKDDNIYSIEMKLTKIGTDLMIKTIKDLDKGVLKSYPQDLSTGKVYYERMFSYTKAKEVHKKLERGLLMKYLNTKNTCKKTENNNLKSMKL